MDQSFRYIFLQVSNIIDTYWTAKQQGFIFTVDSNDSHQLSVGKYWNIYLLHIFLIVVGATIINPCCLLFMFKSERQFARSFGS